jgi:hypothetical protein
MCVWAALQVVRSQRPEPVRTLRRQPLRLVLSECQSAAAAGGCSCMASAQPAHVSMSAWPVPSAHVSMSACAVPSAHVSMSAWPVPSAHVSMSAWPVPSLHMLNLAPEMGGRSAGGEPVGRDVQDSGRADRKTFWVPTNRLFGCGQNRLQ